jgi:hypothetical protein
VPLLNKLSSKGKAEAAVSYIEINELALKDYHKNENGCLAGIIF